MFMNYVLKLKTCPDNPAYSCVFVPLKLKRFEKSSLTPPLGLRILPLLEDSKIDLDVVDDTTVTDTPPWSQSEPQIYLSLTKLKLKDSTNPEVYKQAFFRNSIQASKIYADIYRWLKGRREGCCCSSVVCCSKQPLSSCRLRDHCSIYKAEPQAILLALKQVYQSKEKKFLIFSDSLSALQALINFETVHLLLTQIQELLHKINADKKVFLYGFLDI